MTCFRIQLEIWTVTVFFFFFFFFMKWGLASSAASDVPREIAWYADVRGFDPAVRHILSWGLVMK